MKLSLLYKILFFVCIILMMTGCEVLTSSQVLEVKKFAQASKDYTELPGALAQSYGILQRNINLLSISRDEFGVRDAKNYIDPKPSVEAWNKIENAYNDEHDYKDSAARMDKALSVLTIYSQVLTTLVSDEYTDQLGSSAEKLGKSLDAATNTYNTNYPSAKQLPAIGGYIGMAVRGAGGMYIRHRQQTILQETVDKANPLVFALMDAQSVFSGQGFRF